MSYVAPSDVVESAIAMGAKKARSPFGALVVRGMMGGMILSCAAVFALKAATETGIWLVGALVFPVGFTLIMILGLELVTGGFALIPLAVHEKRASTRDMFKNFGAVTLGHVLGTLAFGLMYSTIITGGFTHFTDPMVGTIVELAQHKTLDYQAMGAVGFLVVFLKAVLCNWLVTLGVVMSMTSTSTGGKIAALWMPKSVFFGLGFEHAVLNLFLIPTSMLLGSGIGFVDWMVWNQIPVFAGNFVGAMLFTAIPVYLAHKARTVAAAEGLASASSTVPSSSVASAVPTAASFSSGAAAVPSASFASAAMPVASAVAAPVPAASSSTPAEVAAASSTPVPSPVLGVGEPCIGEEAPAQLATASVPDALPLHLVEKIVEAVRLEEAERLEAERAA